MASSRKTVASPKALSASRRAASTADASFGGVIDATKPATATARGGLDEQGKPIRVAHTSASRRFERRRLLQHGQRRPRRALARPHLVAGQLEDPGRRPDEDEPGGRTRLGEVGALGQEPVAGIDRIGAGVRAVSTIRSWSR